MDTPTDSKQDITITIPHEYRGDVEFSVASIDGLHEIRRLYVEIVKMHHCVPGPVMIEALIIRTNYNVILVPTIRIYPLFPSSINNSTDGWLLEGKAAELFGIHFEWPSMMAVDIAMKAEVYDHSRQNSKTISSDVLRLQRNGEYLAEELPLSEICERQTPHFVPPDNRLPFSPYLTKLMFIDGFIGGVNAPDAIRLNKQAHEEIAALQATVDPGFSNRLSQIDKILRRYSSSRTWITIGKIVLAIFAVLGATASVLKIVQFFTK